MLMMGRARTGGLAVSVAAAVALAGCGSSQTSSTTQTASTGTTTNAPHTSPASLTCTGSQLALSYAGTEGATGHLEVTVALRNVSGHPCLVRGYPGARLLDRAGRALPLRVSQGHGFFPDTMPAPQTVTLRPGTTAHFGISFVTNNEYAGAHTCRTAAAALFTVPGSPGARWDRVSLSRAPRLSPCGDQLVVSPVHD
jgi:hypothetical protein